MQVGLAYGAAVHAVQLTTYGHFAHHCSSAQAGALAALLLNSAWVTVGPATCMPELAVTSLLTLLLLAWGLQAIQCVIHFETLSPRCVE